jgi:hypothetical protein
LSRWSWPVDLAVRLLVGLLQLGLAIVVLGTPDLGAAAVFLTSNRPSSSGALALSRALLWVFALVGMIMALLAIGREARRRQRRRPSRLAWSLAVALAGVVVLTGGAQHHAQRATLAMSGGSMGEARAELAR